MRRDELSRLEAATAQIRHFHARAMLRGGEEGALVLRLEGYFDGEAAHAVMPQIIALIAGWDGPPRLVVDAEGLQYISSLGIGVLTTARVMAQQRGMTFSLENPQPAVYNVLEILGVTAYMAIRQGSPG
jgi:anti-anti-sigma factor